MSGEPRRPKVMVVDDDVDTRQTIKDLLERQGMEVVSIESGERLLARVEREKPDLVLLDIMMPHMSGWDTFEKLKKLYSLHGWNVYEQIKDKAKGVKVAFVTVVEASPTRIKAMREHGISDYIMKPFEGKELVARVRKILASTLVFLGFQ